MNLFRLYILLGATLFINDVKAQRGEKPNQFWVGLTTGINNTMIQNGDAYSVIQPATDKKYHTVNSSGNQIGMLFTFDFKPWLGFSFQPQYSKYNFQYESENSWSSSSNDLTLNNLYDNRLDYVDLPVFVRYEFHFSKTGKAPKKDHGHGGKKKNPYQSQSGSTSNSKTTLFAEVGYQYSTMLGAKKSIASTETVNSIEGATENELVDVKNLFNHNLHSMVGGVGVSYDVGGSFRIALKGNYRIGFNELINQKTRYANDKLVSKYYNVYDDLKIKNWNITLELLFPLKFIYSSSYKAL